MKKILSFCFIFLFGTLLFAQGTRSEQEQKLPILQSLNYEASDDRMNWVIIFQVRSGEQGLSESYYPENIKPWKHIRLRKVSSSGIDVSVVKDTFPNLRDYSKEELISFFEENKKDQN